MQSTAADFYDDGDGYIADQANDHHRKDHLHLYVPPVEHSFQLLRVLLEVLGRVFEVVRLLVDVLQILLVVNHQLYVVVHYSL